MLYEPGKPCKHRKHSFQLRRILVLKYVVEKDLIWDSVPYSLSQFPFLLAIQIVSLETPVPQRLSHGSPCTENEGTLC